MKKFTPLSKVSKAKVTNALKLDRIEKATVLKQLTAIRAKLADEVVDVSDVSHEKLKTIMESAEKDSFTQLFWTEQKAAFARKSNGIRWHPMMVRFAILLHSQSPSAYRALHEVGVVKLPGESTLRDYTPTSCTRDQGSSQKSSGSLRSWQNRGATTNGGSA